MSSTTSVAGLLLTTEVMVAEAREATPGPFSLGAG